MGGLVGSVGGLTDLLCVQVVKYLFPSGVRALAKRPGQLQHGHHARPIFYGAFLKFRHL